MSNEPTGGADVAQPGKRGDGLDPAGRRAARRNWMRQYLRSSVQDRLAGLDALTQTELHALESAEPDLEPTG